MHPWAVVEGVEGEITHNKLEEMIKELATSLSGVKHEQEYMQVLDILLNMYSM